MPPDSIRKDCGNLAVGELAGVIIAMFVGGGCLFCIAMFLTSDERTSAETYEILGSIAGLSIIWGALGIWSRYRALPADAGRGSFLISVVVAAVLAIIGFVGGTIGIYETGIGGELLWWIGGGLLCPQFWLSARR